MEDAVRTFDQAWPPFFFALKINQAPTQERFYSLFWQIPFVTFRCQDYAMYRSKFLAFRNPHWIAEGYKTIEIVTGLFAESPCGVGRLKRVI